jgi:hypothetical protein
MTLALKVEFKRFKLMRLLGELFWEENKVVEFEGESIPLIAL